MKYIVKCMYSSGMLLSNEEIAKAPSYTGCVSIVEPGENGPSKQYGRRARLLETALSKSSREIIPPLFAVELFELGRGRMMLCGYQIVVDSNTGAVQQHQQSWLMLSTAYK